MPDRTGESEYGQAVDNLLYNTFVCEKAGISGCSP